MPIHSPRQYRWPAEDQQTYATWRRVVVLTYSGICFLLIVIELSLRIVFH